MKRQKRDILYTNGNWWKYTAGAWEIMTLVELEAFETLLHRLASEREYPYGSAHSAMHRTLRARFCREYAIQFDSVPMVVANNGTYFLEDDRLKKHCPDHFATRRIDIDVDPKADCPEWLKMLHRIFADYQETDRQELIDFLQEYMGIALVGGASIKNRRDLCKGLFLVGETRSGKSSILDVIYKLLGGESKISSASISSLGGRFGLEPLVGKSALISGEASSGRTVANVEVLKKLITGDPMQVDRKGMSVIEFQFHGPVIFATNKLPKIDDETNALYNRFVVIEFNQQFTERDAKKQLGKHGSVIKFLEAHGELPGILNWALEGYDRAVERGSFIEPRVANSASERFRRSNDRVYDFVMSCLEYDEHTACASQAVAIACVEYALSQHDAKLSMSAATQSLARVIRPAMPNAVLGRTSMAGKQVRAWSGLRLNKEGLLYFQDAATKNYSGYKDAAKRVNYATG